MLFHCYSHTVLDESGHLVEVGALLLESLDRRGYDRVQQFPLHRGLNNFQAKHLDLQADRMVDLCRFPDNEFLDKLAITVKN